MKRFISTISALIISISVIASDTIIVTNSISLDSDIPEYNEIQVVARDSINLVPGFSFSSGGTRSFNTLLDPWSLDEPVQNINPGTNVGPFGFVDGSKVVGSIAGSSGVSQSGGATYQIPISVPAGTNGMVPQLSVNYNSQQGIGLMGRGWGLSVTSSIVATGMTKYYDGESTAISETDTLCRLVWDGQRLFGTNGTGLEADSFVTEVFSNNQILYKDESGNDYFEINTAEGKTFRYGYLTNSQLDLSSTMPWKWMLDKVSDNHNSEIQYTYATADSINEILLTEISYGGESSSPVNTITFHYSTNDAYLHGYIHDKLVVNNKRLDSISIESSGEYYGSYGFRYIEISGENVLSAVYQYDKDNNSYNPTIIEWEAPVTSSSPTIQQKNITHQNNFTYHTGDFTGDGISDLVAVEINNTSGDYYYYLYEGSSSGLQTSYYSKYGSLPRSFTYQLWDSLAAAYNADSCSGSASTSMDATDLTYVLSGDFDGDGIMELFIKLMEWDALQPYLPWNLNSTITASTILEGGFKYDLCNHAIDFTTGTPDLELGTGCILSLDDQSQGSDSIVRFITGGIPEYGRQYTPFPDLDGRGYSCIPDYEHILYYNPNWKESLEDPTFWDYYCELPDNPTIWGEFNGDGKADYIIKDDTADTYYVKIYNADSSSFVQETTFEGSYLGLADLNNDGVSAYVVLGLEEFEELSYAEAWGLCFGCDLDDDWYGFLGEYDITQQYIDFYGTQCSGFDDLECRLDFLSSSGTAEKSLGRELYLKHLPGYGEDISFGYFHGDHTQYNPMFSKVLAMDVDANGFTDLLFFDYDSLKNTYFNFSPELISGDIEYDYTEGFGGLALGSDVQVGDFNGDGLIELFFPASDTIISYVSSGKNGKLVSEITNGLGVSSRVEYGNMTDPSIYTKGSGSKYPVADVIGPLYMVKSISSDNGVADSVFIEYNYESAKVHLGGKGFLGFMETSVENQLMNSSQTSLFDYDTIFYQSYPLSNTQNVGGITYKISEQFTSVDQISGKRYNVEVDSMKMTYYEDSTITTSIRTAFKYNVDGLIEERSTDYDGDATETIKTSYIQRGSHIAAKPSDISKHYERNGQIEIDSSHYSYSSSGTLVTKKEFCGTDRELSTTFSLYNSFDLPERVIISGKKGLTLTTGYIVKDISYSSDGRFVNSTSDPLDHDKRFTYDPSTGLLTSETGVNRKETVYEYGPFGRKEKVVHPNRILESSNLYWADDHPSAPDSALFYSWQSVSGSSPVLGFFDPLGRELRQATTGYNNESIYVDTRYDSKGRVLKKSMPYFSAGSPMWTTYTYDYLNRIHTEISPKGDTTLYDYDGFETTVSIISGDTTQSYRTNINALGETVESEDNLGNIVYNVYLPDGKLDSSYVNTHNTMGTSFTYDAMGNRISIKDPDAGTITSLYDGFGRLVQQISAKGDTATYEYDDLGRVVKSTDARGDIFTSYIADTTKAAFGMVDSICNSDNSLMEIYNYDSEYGSLLSETRFHLNKTFTNSYVYDWFGRPIIRTYPSGLEIEYTYTDNGDLKTVTGEGLTLWSCSDVNALGQITQYSQGSYTTYMSFDSFGELNQIKTGSIVELNYDFDDFGNLLYREDALTDQKENFVYDDLNRLTGITYSLNSTPDPSAEITIGYDDCGNINSKTGISSTINYGENNAGPHAVTSIVSPDQEYSPPTQWITYNCFNKVQSISDTLTNGDSLSLDINYGLDYQRIKTIQSRNGTTERIKWFNGDYEEDSTSTGLKKYHYIYGGSGLTAIFVQQGSGNDTMHYVMTDHLGSLTTFVNATTSEVKNYSYSAWGVSRDASDWTQPNTEELFVGRGYTGHEHLQDFSMINMNGRFYDPILGRFVSPDPYVQSPGNPNNYNRYAYVLNNPLRYTDPDGEYLWLVLGIYGAIQLGMKAGVVAENSGGDFWKDGFWKGAIVGFSAGALSTLAPFGTDWIGSIAWGALTGVSYHAGSIWAMGGEDYSQIWQGALIGAGLAATFSLLEANNNLLDGYGFKTNQGVMKGLMDDKEYQKLINFLEERFGLEYAQDGLPIMNTIEHYEKGVHGKKYWEESAYTNKGTTDIVFHDGALESVDDLKANYIHEYGHVNLDRYKRRPYVGGDLYLIRDGANGYAMEIYNAGIMEISVSYLKKTNLMWHQMGISKWFYIIPRRFQKITIKPFNY